MTLRRRSIYIVILCAACAAFIWQCSHPFLLLTWPAANEIIGIAFAVGLPWLILTTIAFFRRRWSYTIAVVAALPLLLYSILVLFVSVSFRSFPRPGGPVRTSASTEPTAEPPRERPLLPELLVVRNIDSNYPCYSVEARATGRGIISDRHAPIALP